LHNAAKYTANSGNIKVFLSRQDDTAIFRVCDTGEGIASELLPRIFDTFTQADQSLARSAGGLGVGLALVRRLCELHGGEVRASSAGLGKGSEFEVRLPTVAPPADADMARAQISPVASGGAPLRVLVAEDNRDIANSTTALLELWGHESQMVHSGKDVVPAALIFRPDVVLLDIGLPDVDGFEVARRIRNEPTLVSVRVIAMTGYGQDRDRDRTRETGFNAHLVKPVQAQVLKAMIEQR
jgi:CheY-like chemotaxis protein